MATAKAKEDLIPRRKPKQHHSSSSLEGSSQGGGKKGGGSGSKSRRSSESSAQNVKKQKKKSQVSSSSKETTLSGQETGRGSLSSSDASVLSMSGHFTSEDEGIASKTVSHSSSKDDLEGSLLSNGDVMHDDDQGESNDTVTTEMSKIDEESEKSVAEHLLKDFQDRDTGSTTTLTEETTLPFTVLQSSGLTGDILDSSEQYKFHEQSSSSNEEDAVFEENPTEQCQDTEERAYLNVDFLYPYHLFPNIAKNRVKHAVDVVENAITAVFGNHSRRMNKHCNSINFSDEIIKLTHDNVNLEKLLNEVKKEKNAMESDLNAKLRSKDEVIRQLEHDTKEFDQLKLEADSLRERLSGKEKKMYELQKKMHASTKELREFIPPLAVNSERFRIRMKAINDCLSELVKLKPDKKVLDEVLSLYWSRMQERPSTSRF